MNAEIEVRHGLWAVTGDLSAWYVAKPHAEGEPLPPPEFGHEWRLYEAWGARTKPSDDPGYVPLGCDWRVPTFDRKNDEQAARDLVLMALDVEEEP